MAEVPRERSRFTSPSFVAYLGEYARRRSAGISAANVLVNADPRFWEMGVVADAMVFLRWGDDR